MGIATFTNRAGQREVLPGPFVGLNPIARPGGPRKVIYGKRSFMNKSTNLLLISGLSAFIAVTGLTGCAMWNGKKARETGRTVDQYTNDKKTSDRVEDALDATPIYKFPDVQVSTYMGTVQLSGFVHTEDQKREAAEIARNVTGVNKVIDNIALISEVPTPPTPTGRNQGYQSSNPPNNPAPPK